MKMKIEVLGDGCSRCDKFYENVLQAAKEIGMEVEVVKEMDPPKIARCGVLSLPGLVIDGTLKVSGKLLNVERIKDLIE